MPQRGKHPTDQSPRGEQIDRPPKTSPQKRRSLMSASTTTGPLRTFLAQRIIALAWRLNRLNAAESYLHLTRISLYQEHVEKLNKHPDAKKLATEHASFADSNNLSGGFILAYEYDKREN